MSVIFVYFFLLFYHVNSFSPITDNRWSGRVAEEGWRGRWGKGSWSLLPPSPLSPFKGPHNTEYLMGKTRNHLSKISHQAELSVAFQPLNISFNEFNTFNKHQSSFFPSRPTFFFSSCAVMVMRFYSLLTLTYLCFTRGT